ncbi:hypothetical protein [Streptomyces sp. NPDC056544]|uniref:hypothetical protein n=1 Tax=unclassified Streptomyces TaxID=2593676 RepID=UPI0036745A34
MAAPVYEPYGHPHFHGLHPRPETSAFWAVPQQLQHAPAESPVMPLPQTGSLFTTAIAAVVSVLSGVAICDALRQGAAPHTAREAVIWWPLLFSTLATPLSASCPAADSRAVRSPSHSHGFG